MALDPEDVSPQDISDVPTKGLLRLREQVVESDDRDVELLALIGSELATRTAIAQFPAVGEGSDGETVTLDESGSDVSEVFGNGEDVLVLHGDENVVQNCVIEGDLAVLGDRNMVTNNRFDGGE